MSLKNGTMLGPYEILSQLGAGGMGEVYKARDTRLNRTVAIKTLLAHLADKPELVERFKREAETIANLQHPHICVLYDIRKDDGIDYLVMEYLEGETVAQRLHKGPLPPEQVMRYATEISDALDKAHRKGVTHRDIKPGNIMITKDGSKLLDFGLAKLKPLVSPAVPASQMPTEKSVLTETGTILGTLQYMAPEQLEAKNDEIDARTDIFAFGAVIYEMATGRKAFVGATKVSLIGAILKDEPPPISSLQPMTPQALDRMVKKCLRKIPEERWQNALDITDELKWIAEGSLTASGTAMPARSSGRRKLAFAVAGLAALAVTAVLVWNFKPPPPKPVTRTVVALSGDQRMVPVSLLPLAISPDGTHMVYGAQSGGGTIQLYLREMDSLEARPLSGTEDADMPFFSPDGQWIGFFSGNSLKKVPISGGAVLTLCTIGGARGGSWGGDDHIIFTPGTGTGLFRVSAAGGTPEHLTQLKGEATHRWPEILPGGKAVLFVASNGNNYDVGQIAAVRLDTGERINLIQGGTFPHYVSTGHIVYYRAGTIMAVPFDLKRLEVTGSPAPVVEGVMSTGANNGGARFTISNTGSLVYVPGTAQGSLSTMVWVDRKGVVEPLKAPPRPYGGNSGTRLSPDGQLIVIQIGTDLWTYSVARDTLTRLTFEGSNVTPAWTRDGKRVVYNSVKAGVSSLVLKSADGSGAEERLVSSENALYPGPFTPDGRTYIYAENDPKTGRDILILPLDGDRKPKVFLKTPFNETSPRLSPDGRWLAYISDESGRTEIYVQPFPGPGGKWQISTDGGREMVWAANGEIFYRNGDKLMAVETKTQGTFEAGKPHLLFEGNYLMNAGVGANYDVTADGQRFIMLKGADQGSSATQINVVLNWFEELKRRVPVK